MIKLPEMRREVNNLFNDHFDYNFRIVVAYCICHCVGKLLYCIAIALK